MRTVGSSTRSVRSQPSTRRVAIANKAADAVPPFGIVQSTGSTSTPLSANDRLWLDMNYYDGGSGPLYVNTNKSVVATGSEGEYGHAWPVASSGALWIAYDSADTPAAGDEWGPVDTSSFLLSKDGGGFFIHKVDSTSELVLAEYLGGGGVIVIAEFIAFPDNTYTNYDSGNPCAWARATVTRSPCSGSPAVGTEIEAWDDMQCWLAATAADLASVKLALAKTKGDPVETGTGTLQGTGTYEQAEDECHWTIINRCCLGDIA